MCFGLGEASTGGAVSEERVQHCLCRQQGTKRLVSLQWPCHWLLHAAPSWKQKAGPVLGWVPLIKMKPWSLAPRPDFLWRRGVAGLCVVWPGQGGDAHPAFRRQGLSLARGQGARRQARLSERWERPPGWGHNGIISSQPRLQKCGPSCPCLRHKLSSSKCPLEKRREPLLLENCRRCNGGTHCAFIPSGNAGSPL
jgi:hypothetical protein